MVTDGRRKHPLDLPVSQHNECLSDGQSGICYHAAKVVDQRELPDGKTQAIMVTGNKLAAWDITFRKEPNWLPQKIRFLARGDKPLPIDGDINIAHVKTWEHYVTTTTDWKENAEPPFWLPETVRMDAFEDGVEETREFKFVDWKFGKDVDAELLDKSKFTLENIQNKIDFDAIIERFEQLDANR